MIHRRTLSNPGDEQSITEQKLRNALQERFNAIGAGATPERLAPLEAKIAILKAKLEAPKVQRQKSTEPSEHDEQKAVVEWWGLQCKAWGYPRKALFAIPNGQILIKDHEQRMRVMGYLRAEGFRDGMLDLCLAIPSREFHGLFIEMKRTKGGVASDEQIEYVSMFHQLGYAAGIHRGAASAISAITHYLGRG